MLDLKGMLETLAKINDLTTLEAFNKDTLGKSGPLNQAFKEMKNLDPDARKARGQELSDIKAKLISAYNEKAKVLSVVEINKKLEEELVDMSIDTKNRDT